MNNLPLHPDSPTPVDTGSSSRPGFRVNPALRRRRARAERRFRWYGRLAVIIAFCALGLLLASLISRGVDGFFRADLALNVTLDRATLDLPTEHTAMPDHHTLRRANYHAVLAAALTERFPEADTRQERRALLRLVSADAPDILRRYTLSHPEQLGQRVRLWIPASDPVHMYLKGHINPDLPELERKIKDQQIGWVESLRAAGDTRLVFNAYFFENADSREPEMAGILGALIGSLFTIATCLAVASPLGVLTAIYLEEFAPKNRFADIIEVNINNLAAVPSIVFGLLGLALYINVFSLPRSAALVGGLTLALLILPVIIITTRAALQSIPASIRDAARGLGASPFQVVVHHVLPLAMPGIMTGTILGIARALGETAPLLMIGMVAFIAEIPGSITDPATAMPVQIYLWANNPEMGFVEKTASGILVLLGVLVLLNALAVYIRKRFEQRW